MRNTINTLEVDLWSEPDEQHRVQHIGMANAQETFNKLEKHLLEQNLLPDEYFLFSDSNFPGGNLPDYDEAVCRTNFGGSEGIYLDISLNYCGDFIHFATGKTLREDAEAFAHMSRIGAECSMMLNGRGRKIPLTQKQFEIGQQVCYEDKSGHQAQGQILKDSGAGTYKIQGPQDTVWKNPTDLTLQVDYLKEGIMRANSEVDHFVNSYHENPDIRYDYETVLQLLEKASECLRESARCARPANLPKDMPWSEKLWDGEEENPYVYDGSMSMEDYDRLQELRAADEDEMEP